MGNVFALLGLRALFVLVESLIVRFRYLDETIAIVLGLVGVKLLTEDLYKVGPVASLAVVAGAFTVGIVASLIADRGDPEAAEKRRERLEEMRSAGDEGDSSVVDAAPAEQAGEAEQAGAGDGVDRAQE